MPKGNRQLYEKIIAHVRGREELYNPTSPNYKDKAVCDVAWKEVGEAVGVSGKMYSIYTTNAEQ